MNDLLELYFRGSVGIGASENVNIINIVEFENLGSEKVLVVELIKRLCMLHKPPLRDLYSNISYP